MVSAERDKIILENIALVRSVARRFSGRDVEYDDIFQAGCVGLIKAVDNFDESLGYRFSTYAVPVIMGEIRRIFRDGGLVKVSRSLKEKAAKAQYYSERFVKENGREPTLSELSEISGLVAEELPEILNSASAVLSLNSPSDETESELDVPVDDSDELFDRLMLSQAFSSLETRERALIKYRYYEGKTQCETAELLGISQVQVSRNEKKILHTLRNILQT